jgi:glucosamine--fructose-6-phosphate aminotransferase (isomerizing)
MSSIPPPPVAERVTHPFYTYDMIFEIPQAISDTLQNNDGKLSAIIRKTSERKAYHFTGCGTAFFAAMLGSQVMQLAQNSGIESSCIQTLEFQNCEGAIDRSDVAISISHSGVTKTTIDALNYAKMKGAYCVGISHFQRSPISQVAQETIIAGNGPDKPKCHTKCYVASAVACTKLLIEALKTGGKLPERLLLIDSQLNKLPQIAKEVLASTDAACKKIADEDHATEYYFAGAGPNFPNALEAALKIMETSFVPALGFETEQLLHGPWSALDKESRVIVIAPKGGFYNRTLDLVKAATILGVPVISIVEKGNDEVSSSSDYAIELPAIDEYLSPFINIIPLYLLSYYLSIKRGHNPDLLRYQTPNYWKARHIIFPPGTH